MPGSGSAQEALVGLIGELKSRDDEVVSVAVNQCVNRSVCDSN